MNERNIIYYFWPFYMAINGWGSGIWTKIPVMVNFVMNHCQNYSHDHRIWHWSLIAWALHNTHFSYCFSECFGEARNVFFFFLLLFLLLLFQHSRSIWTHMLLNYSLSKIGFLLFSVAKKKKQKKNMFSQINVNFCGDYRQLFIIYY